MTQNEFAKAAQSLDQSRVCDWKETVMMRICGCNMEFVDEVC